MKADIDLARLMLNHGWCKPGREAPRLRKQGPEPSLEPQRRPLARFFGCPEGDEGMGGLPISYSLARPE